MSFEKITLAAARIRWMQKRGEWKINSEILELPAREKTVTGLGWYTEDAEDERIKEVSSRKLTEISQNPPWLLA